MRVLVTILLVALGTLVTAACGDEGTRVDTEPPPSSPPGSGIPVRGTERLAWDQAAPSHQRLRQYTFRIYVDNAGSALAGVECLDSASGGAYPCSARVPPMTNGTHTIQLAAVADGIESPRSSSITVVVSPGRTVVEEGAKATPPVPETDERDAVVCLVEEVCFQLRRLVAGARPLSSPVFLPDGRLMFVEDARHVRILAAGVVGDDTALSLSEDSRIVALNVDPEFATSRFVRVASTLRTESRGRTLTVTRMRELDGRLGEAAVVVPEIPLPPTGEPRVAEDDKNRIYVAVPGDITAGASDADRAGHLLRYSREGLTWSAGLGAPAFATGFAQPYALAFDAVRSRLWLSGRDRIGTEGLRLIAIGSGAEAEPGGIAAASFSRAIVSLATLDTSTGRAGLLVADDAGQLGWAEGGRAAAAPVAMSGEHVLEIAAAGGRVLLATRSRFGTAPLFSVFELAPGEQPVAATQTR